MSEEKGAPLKLEDDGYCFACGVRNPIGLKLEFETLPGNRLRTIWTPRSEHTGFQGIVHGGLIATVLDEVMIRLLYAMGIRAVTAELKTRFVKPLRAGQPYRFEARIIADKGRIVTAEADGFDAATGEKVASGSATCVRVRPDPL
ncbi:MAG TPA: PaaI family thioesterase [Candidatus Polarisedimenticolia bacterium]|nr:PaaI family thioesterase [Candidatus Polarisedimenticolia bacterium]